jgi:hypothetical protein
MNINHGIIASQFDYDALVFLNAALITNPTQRLVANYWFSQFKFKGYYNRFNAFYPMLGGSAFAHKFNGKNPQDTDAAFRLSFVGGWTHSANGALPNGVNAYANTFLTPSVTLNPNDHSFGIYSRTNTITGNSIYGSFTSVTQTLQNNIVLPPGIQGAFQSGNSPILYPINTRSLLMASRTSSTVLKAFRAGVLLGSSAVAMTSLPTFPFYFGARNTFGTPTQFSPHQLAFAFIGGGFTDAEVLDIYNIVQQGQTLLSRQV